jgi:hypothetical protein
LGYSIFISKVGTVLDQVKDTFYIKDGRRKKIVDPEALAKLHDELMSAACEDGDGENRGD